MVVAVVLPCHESKSAANRDVEEDDAEDLGSDEDISIVLVYNNDHMETIAYIDDIKH